MRKNKLALALIAVIGLMSTAASAGDDVKAGKDKAQPCFACHGENGISPAPDMYPHLAGQHASYLVQALKDYKEGRRQNQIMTGMAEPLSEQDMEDIAAYYASLPGLITVPRKHSDASD